MNQTGAIVVLSGGIYPDGVLPEDAKARVRKGLELFRQKIAPRLVMTGKWAYTITYEPPVTEARAMREYAVALGVPEDSIDLEEESTDTLGNAYFVKIHLASPRVWRRIIIVTSDYHVARSEYLFRKVFGTGTEISFVATPSELTTQERSAKKDREERSLTLARQWLDPIADGDDAAIKQLMFTKHPGYAKNPEVSKEELVKILGPQ